MKRKKAQIIVLYGPMAVGKLTVGKVLSKKLGYKLTHNHLINDLALSVFERGTLEANRMIEKLRYEFYEKAAKSGKNIIITHAYSHNFVSPTGLSDSEYMKKLEKKLKKGGASVLFVHLQAKNKTLLSRVKNVSRKKYEKLTDVSTMKNHLNTKDFATSAPVKNNIVVDNTSLSPQKVAQIIINKINARNRS
ncbi:MAG: AAA family ATPase [Candidatus Liptonbacteria bacterium]|nr:AAA family ATPase [Candidatus Liptonbacteria bacterium]